jgi:hypothetical protein
MATSRRWLQFSLRTFFVLVAALAVALSAASNKAREQRDAVKAIEAMGGTVSYDWQYERKLDEIVFAIRPGAQPAAPRWLRSLIGDELFQEVVGVAFVPAPAADREFSDEEVRRWIPHLRKFPKLRLMLIGGACSNDAMAELVDALPDCNFI